MLSAIFDALVVIDFIATCLRWFVDGLLWLLSSSHRVRIRSNWAAHGRMYKYAQLMSWFFALFVAFLCGLFLLAAFTSHRGA